MMKPDNNNNNAFNEESGVVVAMKDNDTKKNQMKNNRQIFKWSYVTVAAAALLVAGPALAASLAKKDSSTVDGARQLMTMKRRLSAQYDGATRHTVSTSLSTKLYTDCNGDSQQFLVVPSTTTISREDAYTICEHSVLKHGIALEEVDRTVALFHENSCPSGDFDAVTDTGHCENFDTFELFYHGSDDHAIWTIACDFPYPSHCSVAAVQEENFPVLSEAPTSPGGITISGDLHFGAEVHLMSENGVYLENQIAADAVTLTSDGPTDTTALKIFSAVDDAPVGPEECVKSGDLVSIKFVSEDKWASWNYGDLSRVATGTDELMIITFIIESQVSPSIGECIREDDVVYLKTEGAPGTHTYLADGEGQTLDSVAALVSDPTNASLWRLVIGF